MSDSQSNNDTSDNDPLNITELSNTFDQLLSDITDQSNILSNDVLNYVNNRKLIMDNNLSKINENLSNCEKLINYSDKLLENYDLLQQLQIFSKDFNTRLQIVHQNLKK